jgi:hypothetical protein
MSDKLALMPPLVWMCPFVFRYNCAGCVVDRLCNKKIIKPEGARKL